MDSMNLEEKLREYIRKRYSHITTISILAIFGISTQVILTMLLIFLRK